MWSVRVARVESPDLLWVVPNINDLAVQKLMSDIAAAPLEVKIIENCHSLSLVFRCFRLVS